MNELLVENKFGTLDKSRKEMIEIFNNPEAMSRLEVYFNHNKKNVGGQEFYGCNGWDCDCELGRTFAMLKYIAQPLEYRSLISDCSDSQLLSIQNAYYYRYQLPVEEIKFENIDSDNGFKVSINGDLFRESKIQRIQDLGLEDYITVTEPEDFATSMGDTSLQSL